MDADAPAPPANILVALDGSHLAEAALPIASALATALGARVTLLHVLEHEPPATIHGEPHLTTQPDAEDYLARVSEGLHRAGLTVSTHVHPNPQRDVAESIAAHGVDMNADIIVVAAHGKGGIREFLVGRIPQQVAARAGRPVLIVPAPSKRDFAALRRIVLPIDPAGEARPALPLAQTLAAACHAELMLVTIVPTPDTMPGNAGVATVFLPRTSAALLDWAEAQARISLEQLAKMLGEAGLVVSTEVHRGDPARELAQVIAASAADLVVVATHARVGLDGLWAGSVAPRVVADAPCPVLLVPLHDRGHAS